MTLLLATALLAQVFYCSECERTPAGKILRSKSVVRKFKRDTPCPHPDKGCIADHIVPLACAGELKLTHADLDRVGNLQWQTKSAAKEKDKWELKHCSDLRSDLRYRPPRESVKSSP